MIEPFTLEEMAFYVAGVQQALGGKAFDLSSVRWSFTQAFVRVFRANGITPEQFGRFEIDGQPYYGIQLKSSWAGLTYGEDGRLEWQADINGDGFREVWLAYLTANNWIEMDFNGDDWMTVKLAEAEEQFEEALKLLFR